MALMDKIKNAPEKPGCYIFKDEDGFIIYIGKSKCLKNRVKNYFRKIDPEYEKLFVLNRRIRDVEYIITDSEIDALMLEYTLIKRHKPFYNMQHKSDKKYYSLKINKRAEIPLLYVTEEDELEKGCEYFGFYQNIDSAKEALEVLNRVWRTPTCNKDVFKKYERPCLNYHMGRCMGICVNREQIEEYRERLAEIIVFLKGKGVKTTTLMKDSMFACAEELNFEEAERIRVHLDQAFYLQKRSRNLFKIPENRNILVFIRAYKEQGFYIYYVSKGKAFIKSPYVVNDKATEEDFSSFLTDIENKRFVSDNGVIRALSGVYGDKKFVVLPQKADSDRIGAIIKKEVTSYI